jgi:putative methionine-R-sulfoxide reductase with GAF domain
MRAVPLPAPTSTTSVVFPRQKPGPAGSVHWARMDLDLELIDRTVASLHEQEPAFDWVGVYFVDGDTLVLGPFRGEPTEHERIAVGQGVCGGVAATGETEVVPDVRERPGHIVCDLKTRSEVVAPIVREGRVLGVLDIDSNRPDAFGEREVRLVEEAAQEIAASA